MKKGIRRNWKQILCIVLIFVSVLGIIGIGFVFDRSGDGIKDSNDGSDAGITTPGESNSGGVENPTGSKVGLYRNEPGTLNYTYVGGNYTQFLDSELGFKVDRDSLGADPASAAKWNTVMYDRGTDPYLYVGKDADRTSISVSFTPINSEGKKMVFETDFAWLGSKGAGENCSDADPTWHACISLGSEYSLSSEFIGLRFREYQDGVYLLEMNNRAYNVGYLNIGEWYNLRIEVTPSAEGSAKYDVYIDNDLKVSYTGAGWHGEPKLTGWVADVSFRYDSLSGGIYLDNTYVSNK